MSEGQRMVDPAGHGFTRDKGSRRVWCTSCRPPRVLSPAVVGGGSVEALESLAAATRVSLREAGRLDAPEGVAAVKLARDLDRGGHTGSQTAALSREWRATLADALRGAASKPDALDELAGRRQRKAGA